MQFVRLAQNATTVHESPDGRRTVCGRRVPCLAENFRPMRPLFATSRRVFRIHPCGRCNVGAFERIASPALGRLVRRAS